VLPVLGAVGHGLDRITRANIVVALMADGFVLRGSCFAVPVVVFRVAVPLTLLPRLCRLGVDKDNAAILLYNE
jgi:hypothetical protein